MSKKGRLSREERRQRRQERRSRGKHESYAELLEIWEANFNLEKEWRMFFDGATGPTNPGQSGYGIVLYRNGVETDARHQQIGHATSNIAEYRGLIAGLEMAQDNGATELIVCGDSQLIIKQVFRCFGVATPHLKPLRDRAQELAKGFSFIADAWIRRERNVRADELSKVGVPEFSRYRPASETNTREFRRALDAILGSPFVIRSSEMEFVTKMDDQVDARQGMSPKQWKWLQDIEGRIYERSTSLDIARQVGNAERMKPRLVRQQ